MAVAADALDVEVIDVPTGSGEHATPPARAVAEIPTPCDQMLGPYRLRFALATGGMATVYLAVAEKGPARGEIFAVKRVHPHLALRREFVEMFRDEARIASLLHHPNVCGVVDYGEASEAGALDGGTSWWLAMEFLLGEPLARVLVARPQVCSDEAASKRWPYVAAKLMSDACEGLHAAHELRDAEGRSLRVVHRDVSPHNLFVAFDGQLKVVDFGIALAEDRTHRTATGIVKGKFAYMAPEQMRGHKVDRRADLWSVGVVMWEALAGRPLFRAGSESETILGVLSATVPPLAEVAPHVPPELAAIVARALSLSPENRYQTARELARELDRFVSSAPRPLERAEIAQWMERMFPGEHARQRSLVNDTLARDPADGAAAWAAAAAPTGESSSRVPPRSGVVRRPQKSSPPRTGRAFVLGGAIVLSACALAVGIVVGSGALGWPGAPVTRSDGVSGPARLRGSVVDEQPVARAAERAATGSVAIAPPARTLETGTPTAEPASTPRVAHGSERRERERRTFDEVGLGEVHIATSGGWADVSHRGRRLGQTPGRFVLPGGRQTLTLRAAGIGAPRRVNVHVRPGGIVRVRVDLRESGEAPGR